MKDTRRYRASVYRGPQGEPQNFRPREGAVTPAKGTTHATICPVCGATVRVLLLTQRTILKEARERGQNVELGDWVIGKHRNGGGKISIRRGDVPCSAFLLVVPNSEVVTR